MFQFAGDSLEGSTGQAIYSGWLLCSSGSYLTQSTTTVPDPLSRGPNFVPDTPKESVMAPLKAPRYLVADIETNRFDDRNMEYSKSHTSVPALDLSKFPAKKILGVGKRTSKPASKGLKTAGLDTGKSTGVQQLKKRPPQVVKAPKPSGSEGPKHKGSISFAHKARGMGDCYTTWAAAGTNEKSSSTCIKGLNLHKRYHAIQILEFEFEFHGCSLSQLFQSLIKL